jgi:hypothetical protein
MLLAYLVHSPLHGDFAVAAARYSFLILWTLVPLHLQAA